MRQLTAMVLAVVAAAAVLLARAAPASAPITNLGYSVPVTGLYHLNAVINLDNQNIGTYYRCAIIADAPGSNPDTITPQDMISQSKAGHTWLLSMAQESSTAAAYGNLAGSVVASLSAGTIVRVYCATLSGSTTTYFWPANSFSGHLI